MLCRPFLIFALFLLCTSCHSRENSNRGKSTDSTYPSYLPLDVNGVSVFNKKSNSIVSFYDKNQLPPTIQEFYSAKWRGFYIANPHEKWDGGCSGGIYIEDSLDASGKKVGSRKVGAIPGRILICIKKDTIADTYLIKYREGGIATFDYVDFFRVSKDGTLMNFRNANETEKLLF